LKQWVYRDALKPVAELDGVGNLVAQFVFGASANVPDYVQRGGTTYRVVSDHLGSPRYVVNVANASEVPFSANYTSFGEVTGTELDWMPFGFAGGIYDADAGVVRFGARDYDSQTGRWLRKEPLRFGGGTNFYAYAKMDPVNRYDPSGNVSIVVVVVPPIAILAWWAMQGDDIAKNLDNAIGDIWDDYDPDFDDDDSMECYKIAEYEDLNTCIYQCPDGTTPTIKRWDLDEVEQCPSPANDVCPPTQPFGR